MLPATKLDFIGEPIGGANRQAILKEASQFLLALNDRFKSMDHHVQVVTSLKTFLTKIKIGIHLSFQVLASGLDKLKLSVYVLTRFHQAVASGSGLHMQE